jgi:hypothetical protein
VFELGLLEEMPFSVVATAAVLPGTEMRFILDLHTQEQDLRLFFYDPEPLQLLRRAILALLRQSRRVDPVLSVAFCRARPTTTRQARFNLMLDDKLPY